MEQAKGKGCSDYSQERVSSSKFKFHFQFISGDGTVREDRLGCVQKG